MSFNEIKIPIFELDEGGRIKPNRIFHRPWDKLHSRCIEYPFAAYYLGDAECVLDIGIVKSDPFWIEWLENLPINVYAIDYDAPLQFFKNIKFCRSDVRRLPFPDNTFDKVLAVSVIEHIGLRDPQVWEEQFAEEVFVVSSKILVNVSWIPTVF